MSTVARTFTDALWSDQATELARFEAELEHDLSASAPPRENSAEEVPS